MRSTTVATCQLSRLPGDASTSARSAVGSVTRVALLAPGVAVLVVAVAFPEPRGVLVTDLDTVDPLGTLPEVEMRDQEPCRSTVLGMEWLAVVLERDPCAPALQVPEWQVRRIPAVRVRERERTAGTDFAEQQVERHTAP